MSCLYRTCLQKCSFTADLSKNHQRIATNIKIMVSNDLKILVELTFKNNDCFCFCTMTGSRQANQDALAVQVLASWTPLKCCNRFGAETGRHRTPTQADGDTSKQL